MTSSERPIEAPATASRMGRVLAVLAAAGVLALLVWWVLVGSHQVAPPAAVPPEAQAYPLEIQVALDPVTRWQPRTGEVDISLRSQTADLTGLSVKVAFAWLTDGQPVGWKNATDVQLIESQNKQRLRVAVMVPDLDDAPSPFAAEPPRGRRTFLGIVPYAVAWVIVTRPGADGKDEVVANTTLPLGITSETLALIGGVGTIGLWLLLLRRLKPAGLRGATIFLQIIETKGRRASLSQFQVMIWVAVIGASTVYVLMLSGNLIPLTTGTLALLGISGLATIGSQYAAPAPGDEPAAPAWRDLVVSDGVIDVTRVQMLFFTVLVAFFVLINVIQYYRIPEIPQSFLGLMGISNGVYLLSKFAPDRSSVPAAPPAP